MTSLAKSIPATFYSRAFYADIVRQGRGIGGWFILFMAFLTVIPLMGAIPQIPQARATLEDVLGRFPTITIEHQKLSMDQASPYKVEVAGEEGKAKAVIWFDTTLHSAEIDDVEKLMKDQQIVALVTSDFVVIRKNNGTEIHHFTEYKELLDHKVVIAHDDWIDFGGKLIAWGVPLLAVFLFFGALIGTFLVIAFRAILALIMAQFFAVKPDFAGAMRLSAAASIPIALIGFMLTMLSMLSGGKAGYTVPWYIALLIWAAYALFGLRSASKQSS